MPRLPDSSPHTRAVFALLAGEPDEWWYGYDIARRTDLRSGTLYPILARLAERGYLDTRWETDPPEGRPRRHLYRLTGAGYARATELAAAELAGRAAAGRAAAGNAAAGNAGDGEGAAAERHRPGRPARARLVWGDA